MESLILIGVPAQTESPASCCTVWHSESAQNGPILISIFKGWSSWLLINSIGKTDVFDLVLTALSLLCLSCTLGFQKHFLKYFFKSQGLSNLQVHPRDVRPVASWSVWTEVWLGINCICHTDIYVSLSIIFWGSRISTNISFKADFYFCVLVV